MTASRLSPQRDRWAAARARMEAGDGKRVREGRGRTRVDLPFDLALGAFALGLRLTGLYARGVRNALDIRLHALEIALPDLPGAFDGYRILHLADLHIDALDALPARLAALAESVECDLCALTGDYRFRRYGPAESVEPGMRALTAALRPRDGVFAILGNHDCAAMAPLFESLGIRMLVNETATLTRGGEALHLTGLDDVHRYRSEDALAALRHAPPGCRIALVHSPEMVEEAAAAGVSLYLTGHTHGGQVCLPGGLPVVTRSRGRRRFAAGLWREGGMLGYTSRGAGVSGVPVRFNCPGEAALITLRRG